MPIRISLTGAPLMWKEVVANKIVEEFKLLKIDPQNLITKMENIINPPVIDEAEVKKKPVGGKKNEEPIEN